MKRRCERRSLPLASLLAVCAAASMTAPAVGHAPDPAFSGGPFSQDQRLPYHW